MNKQMSIKAIKEKLGCTKTEARRVHSKMYSEQQSKTNIYQWSNSFDRRMNETDLLLEDIEFAKKELNK